MLGRIIFLLEEPSMKLLLDGLLPRLMPGMIEGQHFLCVQHEGKSDLDRSIPRKLGNWKTPGDRFVIVRDTDGTDCIALKNRLSAICIKHGRPDTLIRLVCQELESWYIGDLRALADVHPESKIDTPAMRKRFINPDDWKKPSAEITRLIPTFQKRRSARAMSTRLHPNTNTSPSFRVFHQGVRRIAREMGHLD